MNLKTQYFRSANELTKFVNDPASSVTTVVSIAFDAASGVFVLFYQ